MNLTCKSWKNQKVQRELCNYYNKKTCVNSFTTQKIGYEGNCTVWEPVTVNENQ